MRTNKGCRILR